MAFLHPLAEIPDAARARGLRAFQADGIATQVREALLAGPLLVGYALLLGAGPFALGVLASLGPLSQLVQLPTAQEVATGRGRKRIVWWTAAASRVTWVLVLALPFLVPAGARLPLFLAGAAVATALGTVAGAAWMPWMRDFLPHDRIGALYAARLARGTALAAPMVLLAGLAVDRPLRLGLAPIAVYTVVLGLGAVAGLAGLAAIARIPEPAPRAAPRRPWRDLVHAALRTAEARRVTGFLAAWTFAVNLAAPFFPLYLLERFGLPMAGIVGLTVLSQGATALTVRAWGQVAERYAMSTVLRVSGGIFLLALAAWPLLAALPPEWPRLALLGLVHVVAGVAGAGVTLGTTTLALEVAPADEAPGYLALTSLASGVASGVAPLLAGAAAGWLARERLSLTIAWTRPSGALAFTPLDLHGLDFLWIGAVAVGLYALHRQLALPEGARGMPDLALRALRQSLEARVRYPLRSITTVPGLRELGDLSASLAQRLHPRRNAERPGA